MLSYVRPEWLNRDIHHILIYEEFLRYCVSFLRKSSVSTLTDLNPGFGRPWDKGRNDNIIPGSFPNRYTTIEHFINNNMSENKSSKQDLYGHIWEPIEKPGLVNNSSFGLSFWQIENWKTIPLLLKVSKSRKKNLLS